MRVVWRRELLEPPAAGACEEPSCNTIPMGLDVPLLVAVYHLPGDVHIRVCSPCDTRVLEREMRTQWDPE
jgi:hypothetical protein